MGARLLSYEMVKARRNTVRRLTAATTMQIRRKQSITDNENYIPAYA